MRWTAFLSGKKASDPPTQPVRDHVVDVSLEEPANETQASPFNALKDKSRGILSRFATDPSLSVSAQNIKPIESYSQGYPRLAAFLRSDENFAIYRSFTTLHSRLPLAHQREVSDLEIELDDLDLEHEVEDARLGLPSRLKEKGRDDACASSETEPRKRRQDVFDRIHTKLTQYGACQYLINANEVVESEAHKK